MINRPIPFPILLALVTLTTFSLARAADATLPATATNAAPVATDVPAAAPAVAPVDATVRPTTYTVVAGDTLWDLSHKFHCSVKSLKTLNKLTKNNLKPGQTLQIPPAKGTAAATTKPATPVAAKKKKTTPAATPAPAKAPATTALTTPAPTLTKSSVKVTSSHSSLKAQPVQDFDTPASTFASCPTPPNTAPEDSATLQPIAPMHTPAVVQTDAPVADTAPPLRALPVVKDPVANAKPTDPATTVAAAPIAVAVPATGFSMSSKRPANSKGFATIFNNDGPSSGAAQDEAKPSVSGEWGNKFLLQARLLGDRGIDYAESWRPEGESSAWAMDCSNTSRYLYKVTAGIDLPRTASDQYYYLHLQGKAWDVPQASNGFADCNFLRENLKPGDLLFWENTYKPERQPPITHVMIFLGSNAKGDWIMAGSQTSRGGEHNRRRGGPDIYVFDPTKPCGGYTTWLGMSHHQGRFCAYGRPLEADVKKLSVADNN